LSPLAGLESGIGVVEGGDTLDPPSLASCSSGRDLLAGSSRGVDEVSGRDGRSGDTKEVRPSGPKTSAKEASESVMLGGRLGRGFSLSDEPASVVRWGPYMPEGATSGEAVALATPRIVSSDFRVAAKVDSAESVVGSGASGL
jgi:hypothetical protein